MTASISNTRSLKKMFSAIQPSFFATLVKSAGSLLALDYSIPRLLKKIVNGLLHLLPGYLCSVESLSLHPLSGSLEMTGITVRKKISRETSIPFLFIPHLAVFSAWKDIFMGHFVGRCVVDQPSIVLDVDAWLNAGPRRPPIERRRGQVYTLRQRLKTATPFLLESLEILNGRVRLTHLRGQSSALELHGITLTLLNVTNSGAPATASGSALVAPQGRIEFTSELYLFREDLAGKARVQAGGIALAAYNDLFRSHFKLEITEGILDATAHLQSANGVVKGHVSTVTQRLNVKATRSSGLFQRLEIGVANLLTRWMRGGERDRIAVNIHIAGALDDLRGSLHHVLTNFIRDAFRIAFDARLSHLRYLKGGHALEIDVHYGSADQRKKTWLAMLKEAGSRWFNDDVPQLAAALSYYTCFSLAPLLLLVIGIAGLTFGREAIEGQIYGQLAGIVGRQSAQTIQSMVASAWKPSSGLWAVGTSVITLMLGALGVVSELKDGLNRIMRVNEPGDIVMLIKARVKFLGFILGIGFLLLVSLVASAMVAALGHALYGVLPFPKLMLEGLDLAFSLGMITLLFALIFKYLPGRRLDWHPVWIGSFFSAILFTAGKVAIGFYIGRETVASSYGAAGSVLILLLWVYYSAMISYFGAEFMAVYAERSST